MNEAVFVSAWVANIGFLVVILLLIIYGIAGYLADKKMQKKREH